MNYFALILLAAFLTYKVKSARILGIYPLPGQSHYNLGSALLRELAERGHDVSIINCFGEKVPPKNGTYRDILLTGICEQPPGPKEKRWNMFKRQGLNPFVGAYVTSSLGHNFIELALKHDNIQNLLKSGEKFDVVIVDHFLSDAFKVFAPYFDAPLVLLSPVFANFWVNSISGNPAPPSYVPDLLLGVQTKMTFCERLTNSLIYVFNELLYNFHYYPKHYNLVQKYVPNAPDFYQTLYNASLILLNSHPSLNQPVPHVPNMVEVGGFHAKPPKKLPKEFQEFMDDAKEGVVYFSMGSNLQAVLWPEEKRNAFIGAFSKLKLKVLWKWEDDELPGQPQNVKISKWVPQHDLLAHPNLKLFISHGGFVSSIETAYNGVPVLIIPIFGDQQANGHFAQESGFGRFLNYESLTEEKILETINEMLDNPSYKENAKKRAEIFHDREVSAMDTAIYWVEYVIRNRGAPHLRVAGVDLPWYKYHLLDVAGFLAAIWFASMYAFYAILKMTCRRRKSVSRRTAKKVKKN